MTNPSVAMQRFNTQAENDVRIRLTLALSGSPGRGESEVRGTPNPVRYLTKDQKSAPYSQLPTPVEVGSAEDVQSALRDWERLSHRTELQLAQEMTAPSKDAEQEERHRSEERNGYLSLSASPSQRSQSGSRNEGALVPFSTDNSKLSPYKLTRVERPFRAATLETASSANRLPHAKSTPQSRAQLFKNALRTGPTNCYANYPQSEVTVERQDIPQDLRSDAEYSDTVVGSTAFSPLEYEEQKALIEEEHEVRHRIVTDCQTGHGQLQKEFYKTLMSELTKSFEFAREESQRALEAATKREKGAERARAALAFWSATLVDDLVCVPVVTLPVDLTIPSFKRATPLPSPPSPHLPVHAQDTTPPPLSSPATVEQPELTSQPAEQETTSPFLSTGEPPEQPTQEPTTPVQHRPPTRISLDTESAVSIRCITVFTVKVPPLPELYNKQDPPTQSHSRTPSTPSLDEIPYKKMWVHHHVEEDEMTTCAITIPARDEHPASHERYANFLRPRTPPTALMDEEEYVPPSK